jgi:hypothetical protein
MLLPPFSELETRALTVQAHLETGLKVKLGDSDSWFCTNLSAEDESGVRYFPEILDIHGRSVTCFDLAITDLHPELRVLSKILTFGKVHACWVPSFLSVNVPLHFPDI